MHCSDDSELGLTGIPSVHIVEIGMSPSSAVIKICITASRKRNEINFGLFPSGKSGGSTNPYES